MIKETYKGWAVKATYPKRIGRKPFLVGRYWWFPNRPRVPVTQQLEGHKICLFKTRREAREAIKGVTYAKMSVVRLVVGVREI